MFGESDPLSRYTWARSAFETQHLRRGASSGSEWDPAGLWGFAWDTCIYKGYLRTRYLETPLLRSSVLILTCFLLRGYSILPKRKYIKVSR